MRTKLYALFALMAAGLLVRAQDIHFSQYYESPMTLNPALTGKFDGLYRISGIFRGQYFGEPGTNSIFNTPAVSGEVSLLKDKMNGNALGIGVLVVNDGQASTGGHANTTTAAISVAYTLNLNKKKTTQISLGLQPSISYMAVNGNYEYPQAFNTDLTYNSASPNNEALGNGGKKVYFNFDYGLFFNTHPLEWLTFYLGFSMANVARPNVALIDAGNPEGKLGDRYCVHGGFEFQVSRKIKLIPGFLYQYESKANEANAGLTLGYTLYDKNKNGTEDKVNLYIGLWDRMGNDVDGAFQERNITPKIGLDYKRFLFGFAYDIGVGNIASDAHPVAGIYRPQAYEISLSFIGFGPKPPHDNDYLFNPRY